jgi:PAS domain S-box-containing protein
MKWKAVLASNLKQVIEQSMMNKAVTAYMDAKQVASLENAAMLEAVMASSTVGVAILDRDLRYVRINSVLAEMHGLTIESHMGKSIQQVLTGNWQQLDALFRQILATSEPVVNHELEMAMPSRPDQKRYLLANYYPIKGPSGATIGIGASVVDITERKAMTERQLSAQAALRESEERLKLAVGVHPLGIWDLDLSTGEVRWNPEEAHILGYPPDHLSGRLKDIVSRTYPDDVQLVETAIDTATKTGGPYRLQFRILRPDGAIRWLMGTGKGLVDQTGRTVRLLATNVDITATKEVELQLREAQSLRDRFTSALSHDLRNPLSTAGMAIHLAMQFRDADSLEKREKFLHKAMDALERANTMIEDLLEANRINSGQRVPLKIEKCDLFSLTQHTIEELALSHGNRFVLHGTSPIDGYWSSDRLRRVIENLATNAIKYGSKETPITINLTALDEWVELRIHNFGGELSPKEQKHLFELFQRTKTAVASGHQGWGIGLPLVKGIVEAHGGRIWLESHPGSGTTFIIELPRDARSTEA